MQLHCDNFCTSLNYDTLTDYIIIFPQFARLKFLIASHITQQWHSGFLNSQWTAIWQVWEGKVRPYTVDLI